VTGGGGDDDAPGCALYHQWRELPHEHEVTEVVRADLHLEAVGGEAARDRHHARVVHQEVELRVRRESRQRLRHRELRVGGGARLKVGREVHGRPVPIRKSALEQRVVLFGEAGARGEVDVDEQRPGRRGLEHLQQARVMLPRPGPLVQRRQAIRVDSDDDDVATALVTQRGRARIGGGVVAMQ